MDSKAMRTEDKKRAWAEIKLQNIRHNYEVIRATLPAGCRFLGVVKADAYGHGALRVSQLLQEVGADYLAVAGLDEALELRAAGITMPILILGHTSARYTKILIDNNITQTVTCLAKAEEYSRSARALGGELAIHIKVDTGMGRLGFLVEGELGREGVEHIAKSCTLPGLRAEGIYTHFAVSDEPDEASRDFTHEQFDLFMRVIGELEAAHGVTFEIRHCANTGAVLDYPEMALDMVRPGLLLYGYGDLQNKLDLRPCMRFAATVSTIKHYEAGTSISYGRRFVTSRHTRMGVISAGYADGLPRISSGKCTYWTENGPAPQCGNICMDMCMVDLTDAPQTGVGSEVEIFGENCSIYQISEAAGTIPYELLCGVSKRVPRVYE